MTTTTNSTISDIELDSRIRALRERIDSKRKLADVMLADLETMCREIISLEKIKEDKNGSH